jgi:hypothetical protein
MLLTDLYYLAVRTRSSIKSVDRCNSQRLVRKDEFRKQVYSLTARPNAIRHQALRVPGNSLLGMDVTVSVTEEGSDQDGPKQ